MDHVSNVICGGIAGIVTDLLLYPLDTLKTRSQVNKDILFQSKAKTTQIPPKLIKKRNLKTNSLYSGLFILLSGDLPSSAAFYGVYELTKDILNANNETKKPSMPLSFIYFMGSSFGQITSLVIRNPFEVVKQQLQAGLYTGTGEAFYNIYRLQGIRGLYAGFFSTLIREIPFDGIQFVLWEKFKSLHYSYKLSHYISDKGKLNISTGNVIVSALSGSFAGGVAGALTNPLDVVKTRMMTQGEKKMYKSTWDCLTKIAVDEGTSALFKGLGLRVTWLTLGGFVFFAVLEAGKVTVKPILIKDYKIH